MATADPVGTAIASIGAGATSGAGVMAAGVLAVRLLQRGDPGGLSTDAAGMLLSVTVSAGLLVAVFTAWYLSRAIDDRWRRGVTAGLAIFGTVLLSVVAAPIDMVAGALGLGVYLVVLTVVAVRLHRTARRTAAA